MTSLAESDSVAFHTLSTQTQQLIEQVELTKRPLVITRQGHSSAVLLNAEDYHQQQQQLVLMQKIAQGKQEMADGRTHSQEEVESLLDSWLPDSE